jgi:hypothetical protein
MSPDLLPPYVRQALARLTRAQRADLPGTVADCLARLDALEAALTASEPERPAEPKCLRDKATPKERKAHTEARKRWAKALKRWTADSERWVGDFTAARQQLSQSAAALEDLVGKVAAPDALRELFRLSPNREWEQASGAVAGCPPRAWKSLVGEKARQAREGLERLRVAAEEAQAAEPEVSPSLLSSSDLADRLHLSRNAVEVFLRRYRRDYPDCAIETEPEGRRRNEPRYLYRVADVLLHLRNHFSLTDG